MGLALDAAELANDAKAADVLRAALRQQPQPGLEVAETLLRFWADTLPGRYHVRPSRGREDEWLTESTFGGAVPKLVYIGSDAG